MYFDEEDLLSDYYQDRDNREYIAALCKEPHDDGTTCMPAWDGYMFVCINRIICKRERS